LQSLGVHGAERDAWQQACAFAKIVENIAPWKLRHRGVESERLGAELHEAKLVIWQNVKMLKKYISQ
jgi:hypothetical protein